MKKLAVITTAFGILLLLAFPGPRPAIDQLHEDNDEIIAEAGPDQILSEGEMTSLNGTGSVGSLSSEVFGKNLKVNDYHPFSSNSIFGPEIEIDFDDSIHVIWNEYTGGVFQANTHYSKSTDGGTTFGPDALAVNGTPLDAHGISLNSRLAVDQDRAIHLIWTNWSKGGHHPEVFYTRSTDEGLTFETSRLIATDNASSSVEVDSEGRIHLLLHGTNWELYHVVSEDGGENFGQPVAVTDPDIVDQSSYHFSQSKMVVDMKDNIHVVWIGCLIGGTKGEIFYSKSTDGGISFRPNVRVDVHTRIPGFLSLDTDMMDNPHVAWIDSYYNEPKIYYSFSRDKGETFEDRILVRGDGKIAGSSYGFIGFPRLRVGQDNTPRVAWAEYFETYLNANLWLSRMDFANQNFSKPILITDDLRNDTYQSQLSFALDGDDRSHLVWMDDRNAIGTALSYDVYYAKSEKGRAAITSYEWDTNNFLDSDGDRNPTNDIDVVGPTPTVTYGDDGTYTVTLKVTDEAGAVAYDTANVTVLNLKPSLSNLTYEMGSVNASIRFRIAGEKWHNVEVYLLEDGVEIGFINITRYPGSPEDQTLSLATDISMDLSKEYSATAQYTPEDDPVNGQAWGATPAWLILRFDNEERSIHHTFNARQEDTWIWKVDDLNRHFPIVVTFEATAYDPGSDDLRFKWDFGDGVYASTMYYSNGIGPDPYPSPDVNVITVTDVQKHTFMAKGTYAITIIVEDDDGGIVQYSFDLKLLW